MSTKTNLVARVLDTKKARREAREAVREARAARRGRQAGAAVATYEQADEAYRQASRALEKSLDGLPWAYRTSGGANLELFWAESLGDWVTIPKDLD